MSLGRPPLALPRWRRPVEAVQPDIGAVGDAGEGVAHRLACHALLRAGTKKSADYNATNGLPAGTLLEGAVFEIYDKAGNLVDTIKSSTRGLAVSNPGC